jgi:HSP20 family protein
MALVPRGFHDLQSEMSRLFDRMLGGLLRRPSDQEVAQTIEWAPSVDALSEGGDMLVRAELPGLKPEDVDITLQSNVLTISGERKAEREEEHGGYYVRERRYGSFRRSMPLPEGVDESKIRARFENGVLEVRVEGAGAVEEPKRIQIESGSGS